MWRFLGIALTMWCLAPAAPAQTTAVPQPWVADGAPGTFQHEFARRLYHESLPSARDFAMASIADVGQVAEFAYGAALFFEAVEGLVADLSRHGLLNHPDLAIPFLRLPVPQNPSPEPIDYATFRGVLQAFIDRLAAAGTALAGIDDPGVLLPLRPFHVRMDLNGDGAYDAAERALPIFATVIIGAPPDPMFMQEFAAELRRLEEGLAAGDPSAIADLDQFAPVFGFDAADAAWLAGYTHLLSAMVELALAHDWEASFNQSFHVFFPQSDLPYSVLNEIYRKRETQAGFVSSHELALAADLLSFAVHSPWRVVEPEKLLAARGHLKAMIAASRKSWGLIRAETDNLRTEGAPDGYPEWIPAPEQRQPEGRRRVTQGVVDGWLQFLDAFERMLDGDLLIPHYRFQQGLNLRRMFEEPRPLSPILMLQGAAALPYLQDGPVADSAYMEEIMGLLGGDFLAYFFWFN